MNTPLPEKILILGCAGFIGSHLLDRLLQEPRFTVEGWDLDDTKIKKHLDNPKFTFVKRDISTPQSLVALEQSIEACDMVFSLAAICNPAQYNRQPLNTIRSNYNDMIPVVDMCARMGRWLCHFSTSEVYGRTLASHVTPGDYPAPDLYELQENSSPLLLGPVCNQRWSYAAAKQLLERYIVAHHFESNLPFTMIRPFNFFGPRMDFIPGRDGEGVPRVLACFVTALLDRKPLQLVDGGHAQRTILWIGDAIDALMAMLDRPQQAQGEIFNLGSRDTEVSMAQLAHAIRQAYAEISGDESYLDHPIETVSSCQFYGPGYEDSDRRMPNVENVWQKLGWKAKTPLDETLRETVAYYHALYGVKETV
ncbi:NAD-dependent epimerase/dehydratase family protein [Magnetococcus sp. PR-3]|uniref:NAD-dependent epimerase/dehydratase family protein n=1 Tax=Magnetococcus sp. PR-3 TaxID=3120355 RepID=UPI002FCE667C